MKKFIFLIVVTLFSSAAFAAAHTAAPTTTDKPTSDKNTAAVLPDEKAENAGDKKAVKSITPKVRDAAKEEADKTKTGTNKSVSPAK